MKYKFLKEIKYNKKIIDLLKGMYFDSVVPVALTVGSRLTVYS